MINPEWCEMYNILGSIGVLSISSVPNDNVDVDIYGDMPSTCDSEYDEFDNMFFDAAWGNLSVDLAAPGNNSYTILNHGGYGYFGGTSAAAPYVTGVVGMMYCLSSEKLNNDVRMNPGYSAKIRKECIIGGVDKLPDFEYTTVSGGRLNAFKSLKMLCDYYGESYLYENIFEPLSVSIYQNPSSLSATLKIETNIESTVEISLCDVNGKLIRSYIKSVNEGINYVDLDINNINRGLYIISVKLEEVFNSVKLIIR